MRTLSVLAALPALAFAALSVNVGVAHAGGTSPYTKETGVFKVTLYGIQRFDSTTTTQPGPEGSCWNEKGTYRTGHIVRYKPEAPVLMKLTKYGPYISASALRARDRRTPGGPLRINVTSQPTGSEDMQVMDCINYGLQAGWQPKPKKRDDCPAVDNVWFANITSGSRPSTPLAVSGGEGLIIPIDDPWKNCQFGDQSNHLYKAEGRWPSDLFAARRSMAVLRHRTSHESRTAKHHTKWTKANTAYLTFVRVR